MVIFTPKQNTMANHKIRNTKTIIAAFSERMEESNISKYRLWKMTGIDQSQLKRYFDGENDMPVKNFLKICEALKLSIKLIPFDAK